MPKPDTSFQAGRARIERKGEKYSVKLGRIDLRDLSSDEVAELSAALMAIVHYEHQEMLEARRRAGGKTYVEYRGEQVVREY